MSQELRNIESELSGIGASLRDIRAAVENPTELPAIVSELSVGGAIDELAQAVLDGRVSVVQSMPSRNSGRVRYSIEIEPKADS